MIHIFLSQFSSSDAISQSQTKQHVKNLVHLEKSVSKTLQNLAISKVLNIPLNDVVKTRAELVMMRQLSLKQKKLSSENASASFSSSSLSSSSSTSTSSSSSSSSALSSKPYFPGVQFNTSNEAGTVIVAVTSEIQLPLGIDLVEEHYINNSDTENSLPLNSALSVSPSSTDFDTLDPEYLSLMMLTSLEIRDIRNLPTRRLRQRLYAFIISVKEAFLKYHGIGLVGISSFNDVQVTIPQILSQQDPNTLNQLLLKQIRNDTGNKDNDIIQWVDIADTPIIVDFVASKKPQFLKWVQTQHRTNEALPNPSSMINNNNKTEAFARMFIVNWPSSSNSKSSILGSIVSSRFPAPVSTTIVGIENLDLTEKKKTTIE